MCWVALLPKDKQRYESEPSVTQVESSSSSVPCWTLACFHVHCAHLLAGAENGSSPKVVVFDAEGHQRSTEDLHMSMLLLREEILTEHLP